MNDFVNQSPFDSYLGRPQTPSPKPPFNQTTLKYSIGDKIKWKDETGTEQTGVVTNISYYGLDVLQDFEDVFVPFENITNK